jgi:hypothetical protein
MKNTLHIHNVEVRSLYKMYVYGEQYGTMHARTTYITLVKYL